MRPKLCARLFRNRWLETGSTYGSNVKIQDGIFCYILNMSFKQKSTQSFQTSTCYRDHRTAPTDFIELVCYPIWTRLQAVNFLFLILLAAIVVFYRRTTIFNVGWTILSVMLTIAQVSASFPFYRFWGFTFCSKQNCNSDLFNAPIFRSYWR